MKECVVVGGVMRFSSKQKILEMVLQTVFKIPDHEISQVDILRTVTNLLNDLDKTFILKNEMEENEVFNELLNISNGQFFAKMHKREKELTKIHFNNIQVLLKDLFQHLKAHRRFTKALKALSRIRHMMFEDYVISMIPKTLPTLPTQSQSFHHEILRIMSYRQYLARSIEQRQFVILASRKYQIERILQLLILQRAQEMDFFKGMSYQNKKKFIKRYFKIQEKAIIQKVKIELTIQVLLINRSKDNAPEKSSTLIGYTLSKSKHAIENLQEEVKHIQWQALQKVKSLGDETGNCHLNHKQRDYHCLEKCQAFEKHDIISEALQNHLAMTKEQTVLIEKEKQQLAMLDQQLNTLHRNQELRQAMVIDDLELVLDELGIDPDIDLSQLSDIEVDNLNVTTSP